MINIEKILDSPKKYRENDFDVQLKIIKIQEWQNQPTSRAKIIVIQKKSYFYQKHTDSKYVTIVTLLKKKKKTN